MKVIDLQAYKAERQQSIFVCLALCLECQTRWVAGITDNKTPLFQLECPSCHKQNSFATIIPSECYEHFGIKR